MSNTVSAGQSSAPATGTRHGLSREDMKALCDRILGFARADQTRVTVEHRGWDEMPQDHVARHGFELMLFQRRKAEHWRGLLASFDGRLRRDGG